MRSTLAWVRGSVAAAGLAMVLGSTGALAQGFELPDNPNQPPVPERQPQQRSDEILGGLTGPMLQQAAAEVYDDADLRTDAYGDPIVIARTGETSFAISTYGCSEGQPKVCPIVRLLTYVKGPFEEDQLGRVNGFNKEKLLGRTVLDKDNDIAIDWSLVVTGVTPDFVVQHLRAWRDVVLPGFTEAFGAPVSGDEEQREAPTGPSIEAKGEGQETWVLPANATAEKDLAVLKAALDEAAQVEP